MAFLKGQFKFLQFISWININNHLANPFFCTLTSQIFSNVGQRLTNKGHKKDTFKTKILEFYLCRLNYKPDLRCCRGQLCVSVRLWGFAPELIVWLIWRRCEFRSTGRRTGPLDEQEGSTKTRKPRQACTSRKAVELVNVRLQMGVFSQ